MGQTWEQPSTELQVEFIGECFHRKTVQRTQDGRRSGAVSKHMYAIASDQCLPGKPVTKSGIVMRVQSYGFL